MLPNFSGCQENLGSDIGGWCGKVQRRCTQGYTMAEDLGGLSDDSSGEIVRE
jgi:hypothetical protein